MVPSPWGSAPNCCDRAADDSESADPEQQEVSPQPLGTGRYRLSPHCLNIPGGLRFVSSPNTGSVGDSPVCLTEVVEIEIVEEYDPDLEINVAQIRIPSARTLDIPE